MHIALTPEPFSCIKKTFETYDVSTFLYLIRQGIPNMTSLVCKYMFIICGPFQFRLEKNIVISYLIG